MYMDWRTVARRSLMMSEKAWISVKDVSFNSYFSSKKVMRDTKAKQSAVVTLVTWATYLMRFSMLSEKALGAYFIVHVVHLYRISIKNKRSLFETI